MLQRRSGGLLGSRLDPAERPLKAGPLRKIIIDIVRQNPEIDAAGLLEELRHRQGDGIIDEIDETYIHFRHAGKTAPRHGDEVIETSVISVSTPISGLKHRLTRARKKIGEKNRSR